MAWRDRFLGGTFRGAAFEVDAHEALVGGRRIQMHEYPGRDVPFAEDLGRAAQQFEVKAFVVGDDYDRARDALMGACNRAGPGILVHPWLGTRRVICVEMRVKESTKEGRMARFEMRFAEAGRNILPAGIANPDALIASALDAAHSALTRAFNEAFRS